MLAALLSGCGGTVQFQDDTALSIRVKPPVKEEPKRVEVKRRPPEIREKISIQEGRSGHPGPGRMASRTRSLR